MTCKTCKVDAVFLVVIAFLAGVIVGNILTILGVS